MMRKPLIIKVVGGAVLLTTTMGAVWVWGWKAWPTRQALLSSRFKLVDDFNDRADPNLIGGWYTLAATEKSRISSRYLKTQTPGPGAMAYQVEAALAPEGSGHWSSGLNGLDISAATHLVCRVRTDPPRLDLDLELADTRQHTASVSLRDVLRPRRGWQRIRLPLHRFRGVDFNRLDRLTIRLRTKAQALNAAIVLDDVAFEGPARVFFRSLQDNLYGFADTVRAQGDELARLPDGALLRMIASDTWGYFRDLVDRRHHLPLNSVQVEPEPQIGDYTSPTDIALYLLGVLSAHDLTFIKRDEALGRVRSTLTQLSQLATWRGLFYNYYSTTNLQVQGSYVSSVDNGWLAAALIVLRQAFPELATQCTTLLERVDFHVFYDEQQEKMRLGYDADTAAFSPYHYGLLATEARILSLVAIGKTDVPERHWFRVHRTLPKEWDWQRQTPQGTYRRYRDHDVFQGHYTYNGVPFVPSWGGSLFEFLMPTLLVKERELAPAGLGLNDQRAVEFHIRYALTERGYPIWGLSPCATPNPGGYKEFGVTELGAKGYEDQGVVSPYSSLLALEFAPEAVLKNVRQMLLRYPLYGAYGLYDAVDVKTGQVAPRYLALDQGMILLAINNYLNEGILRRRFHADPVVKRIEWLLETERFF